ncbi:MAG: divalent-cation tolerance protein CutA [Myxococcales bacterium]|nr:MAG: divalent-cation tolerance protein CutA [Myxococcales bacterium]
MIQEHNKIVVALATFPKKQDWKKFFTQIIEHELAACINIVNDATSIYRYKKQLCIDEEVIAIIKLSSKKQNDLEEFFKKNHPYEVFELLFFNIQSGFPAYLDFVLEHI